MSRLNTELSFEPGPSIEHIKVENDPLGHPCPAHLRDRVMVDVIHDGNVLPPNIVTDVDLQSPNRRKELKAAFIQERDWGQSSWLRPSHRLCIFLAIIE